MKRNGHIIESLLSFRYNKQAGLIILFVFANLLSYSQRWAFEFWHDGRIVLLQGDTLKGMVKYDLKQNMVQFGKPDQTYEAYSARKILFFEIFDNTVHRYRQFYVLPYATAGTYEAPVFFELLTDGKMTLLARESLELRTYSFGFYGQTYTQEVLPPKYYFLNDKGEINEFTGNKGDLLNMMGRNADTVDKYIRSNKLKFDEKYDFARIIAYYNSLHRS
jgi:hypothetical protein